jgi:homoserine kinase type II
MVRMSVADELQGVLELWGLDPVVAAERAMSGTMNETFIVRTERRRVVLRRHRRRDRWRVDLEHSVIAEARRQGVRTPASIATPEGDFVVERDGVLYSLFAFARGRQLNKDQLTPARAWSMGQTLASIHVALVDFPFTSQEPPDRTSDVELVLATIDRLLRRIDQRRAGNEQDVWARDHLYSKARWLEGAPALSWQSLPARAVQVGHGDYQETNLFFHDDRVVDVIDWDKAESCWPVAEIVRCLDLALRLKPDLCQAMIHGYRSVGDLSLDDLDLAASNYGYDRAHSLWLYEEIYDRRNDRPRAFLEPGPFVPFATQWEDLGLRSSAAG